MVLIELGPAHGPAGELMLRWDTGRRVADLVLLAPLMCCLRPASTCLLRDVLPLIIRSLSLLLLLGAV